MYGQSMEYVGWVFKSSFRYSFGEKAKVKNVFGNKFARQFVGQTERKISIELELDGGVHKHIYATTTISPRTVPRTGHHARHTAH